jgi:hypothetical protein
MSPEARGWSQQSEIANRLKMGSLGPRRRTPDLPLDFVGTSCLAMERKFIVSLVLWRRDRNRDLQLTREGDGDDPELPCGRRERALLAKRAAKSARHGRTFARGTCSGFEARQHHQTGVRGEPAFRREQHAYPDGLTNKALEVLALGQMRQSSGLERSQVFRHRHSTTRAQTASTNPNGHAPCKKP